MERVYFLTKDTSLFTIIYDLRVLRSLLNWYAVSMPISEESMFKEIVKGKYYTLDPIKVEQAITPWTTAILAVHVFGYPCKLFGLFNTQKRTCCDEQHVLFKDILDIQFILQPIISP